MRTRPFSFSSRNAFRRPSSCPGAIINCSLRHFLSMPVWLTMMARRMSSNSSRISSSAAPLAPALHQKAAAGERPQLARVCAPPRFTSTRSLATVALTTQNQTSAAVVDAITTGLFRIFMEMTLRGSRSTARPLRFLRKAVPTANEAANLLGYKQSFVPETGAIENAQSSAPLSRLKGNA